MYIYYVPTKTKSFTLQYYNYEIRLIISFSEQEDRFDPHETKNNRKLVQLKTFRLLDYYLRKDNKDYTFLIILGVKTKILKESELYFCKI